MRKLFFVAMIIVLNLSVVSCEKESVDEQTIGIIEEEIIPQATGKGNDGSPGNRNGDEES